MDINSDARATMNRWRTRQKNAERRIINLAERINLRLETILERTVLQRQTLPDWQIKQVYYRDVGQYEAIDDDWRPIKIGESWGGKDVSAFFRRKITYPESMAGKPIYLKIYVGGDSLLRLDGVAHHGLDPFRNTVLLTDSAVANESHDIELESFIYWYPSEPSNYNVFSMAELVTVDTDVESAYWDFVAVYKALLIDNIDNNLQTFLQTHLWNALSKVPIHEADFEVFKAELMRLCAELRKAVFDTTHFKPDGLMHMVGHSHLDIVYVWAHREYIRKIGRTHATMLRLMEQYPDFKFSQSSAKIYSDMKTHFPDIYAQVKQRIKEGRWQAVGAFWLEPDCNLISGESFVRHIIHGQRFWKEEFDFTSQVCWQPDVFGMSWALPQILKRSGIKVIMSNKFFVWNDTNPWKRNTFWWQGPDGSQVMTVIPPGHFIGMVDPDHMDKYWRSYSDKETIGETIYTYGWGDGGGGVDVEMLECANRYQDFPGLVRTQYDHPEDTLLRITERAQTVDDLPIWNDELYLEAHRGTYTSKGRLKKHNRQSEVLLRQIEMLASLAWLQGADYPLEQLDTVWKVLLGTQFHDALPGTHITEVYHYLLDEYATLQRLADKVCQSASEILFGDNEGNYLLVFNPLLAEREGIITLPGNIVRGHTVVSANGHALIQQTITALEGDAQVLMAIDEPVPSVGYQVFELSETINIDDHNDDAQLIITERSLENRYLRAIFSDSGELVSLWDKQAQREIIYQSEQGNKFQLYEDRPGKYDAWDIVSTYVEHELPLQGAVSLSIDERGPLRVSLKLVKTFFESTIIQRISLTRNSRAMTFETQVDWHERQRLLKVGFPLAINCRYATYDIAYGNIERPTHRNTSYDAARFEVPAHGWMDMSERGYGVALLNDCKYGHEANNHWMRLTLLKGSISPDPEADRETHHFTYALYPHQGDWRDGGVIQASAQLNTPLYTQRISNELPAQSFINCDVSDGVTLEAMKQSEDGQSLIIRLVERHNALTQVRISVNFDVLTAYACDLMENIESELEIDGHTIHVALKPHEIVTIRANF